MDKYKQKSPGTKPGHNSLTKENSTASRLHGLRR